MNEEHMKKAGNALAKALFLKRDPEHADRWQTAWGSKTDIGLYLTVKSLLEKPLE